MGVVVPAAVVGRHAGAHRADPLATLAGRSLLAHAVAAMEANRWVAAVVVASHPEALDDTAKLLADEGFAKVTAVVRGGPTRRACVAAGLAALPAGLGHVAVHDAARPLTRPGAVDRLLALLLEVGAAGLVPVVPVVDTIRRVGEGRRSAGLVDRDRLRATQTPQLFVREALQEAHRLALRDGLEGADDAALVELAGHPVQVVPGDPENLKVTTTLDLAAAEALLARRRGRPPAENQGPAAAGSPGPGPEGPPS